MRNHCSSRTYLSAKGNRAGSPASTPCGKATTPLPRDGSWQIACASATRTEDPVEVTAGGKPRPQSPRRCNDEGVRAFTKKLPRQTQKSNGHDVHQKRQAWLIRVPTTANWRSLSRPGAAPGQEDHRSHPVGGAIDSVAGKPQPGNITESQAGT